MPAGNVFRRIFVWDTVNSAETNYWFQETSHQEQYTRPPHSRRATGALPAADKPKQLVSLKALQGKKTRLSCTEQPSLSLCLPSPPYAPGTVGA